jgi:hypothetical protein
MQEADRPGLLGRGVKAMRCQLDSRLGGTDVLTSGSTGTTSGEQARSMVAGQNKLLPRLKRIRDNADAWQVKRY